MDQLTFTINGRPMEVPAGTTILEAARKAAIYIPALCSHPDLPPAEGIHAKRAVYRGGVKIANAQPDRLGEGCGLCLVEVEGEPDLVRSCLREVRSGMVVTTENERIRTRRRENLIPILARHPHACLTCAQQDGCDRSQCFENVPENERCCTLFGHCELQNMADYVGISSATPKWVPTELPIFDTHALFVRDYNLCIGCTRCVRVCREVMGIEAIGFVYDETGKAQIGSVAPTLEASGCKFCTVCVEVCPTGALLDKFVRPGKKAEDIVPCKEACPAHIDVPGYLRLVAQGKEDSANAVIREKVPFPGVLGRVCTHPCEAVCRRGEVNEPIAICAVKRYAADADTGFWKQNCKIEKDTGKRVAVIGAGPAGLTAAFYLRKQGHTVTVFESRNAAGGMMRYGIPPYRLPRELLDKEIRDILALGIEFEPNQTLGKDFTLDHLKADGYDGVFLAVGARLSRRIPLPGADLPDVLWGMEFLSQIAEGANIRLKEDVIVIGGGNVALDAALSALRCGAKHVTMACLERREEMPAHDREIEGAVGEGVYLMPSWGPHKVLSDNNRVTGMELIRCRRVFDARGNFCPTFDDAKEKIEGDQVIMAIGQAPDLSFLEADEKISTENGLIVVKPDLRTDVEGVYAGGDVVEISGAIIHAVAAGRKAAAAIDKALGGAGDIDEVLFERPPRNLYLDRDEGFASRPRVEPPELELAMRHQGFEEVVFGYTRTQAMKEAGRCLQCDLRLHVSANPSPPEKVLLFDEEHVKAIPETEGVFQLFNTKRKIVAIEGTPNLRKALLAQLDKNDSAAWFNVEEDKMYSKRESELIRQHLQARGEMPGVGGVDMDDLF